MNLLKHNQDSCWVNSGDQAAEQEAVQQRPLQVAHEPTKGDAIEGQDRMVVAAFHMVLMTLYSRMVPRFPKKSLLGMK